MNVSRLLLGVFGIVVAGVFFFDASDYPRAAAQMPMIYAVAVGLLSLAMVASELRLQRRAPATGGSAAEPADREADEAPPAPTTLGYVLATALFMTLALAILRTVKWSFALIAGAVLIAMVCLVFVQFLGLPIPLLPSFL